MNAIAACSCDEKHQRRVHTNSASRVLSPRSPFFSQKSQSRFHGVLRPSALKQIFKVFNWSAERDWKGGGPKDSSPASAGGRVNRKAFSGVQSIKDGASVLKFQ